MLLHVFTYLKKHMNTEIVFYTSELDIDTNSFHLQNWSYSIYSLPGEEIREALLPNMLQLLLNGFTICCFVEADHAGESLTRRLRTGLIVMLKNAPIYLYYKRQTTVDTSTFGSEFMAMNQAVKYLGGL